MEQFIAKELREALGHLCLCSLPAETEPHEGKRKVESLWPIFRIHHQKTRYIFDLFYKRKAISRGEEGRGFTWGRGKLK